jgi:hypothetical protein
MRVFYIVYIILSLVLNFVFNSLTTLLLAFLAFPMVLLLVRSKKRTGDSYSHKKH